MTGSNPSSTPSSWFGDHGLPPAYRTSAMAGESASGRLWNGFMTGRVMIALVLLVLQASAYLLGQPVSVLLTTLCAVYLAATLAVRLIATPKAPGQAFDTQWVATIGVDVMVYSLLHFLQGGNINYTPLFALPVLVAAVLGSMLLALGTTAAVTLLLLTDAWWMSLHGPTETTARFLQAGLTGSGLFIVAFLTNQLALRLSREEEIARRNEREARIQTLVNELVIENLTDGVLVIDNDNVVRAANPSARQLVGREYPTRYAPFLLASEPGWQPLAELARMTFIQGGSQITDIDLHHPGLPRSSLQVRTRLATTLTDGSESLCVMFLQDRREIEARVRTEKLAAMGRMSAAVAHEIRNPLAAIAQANALLDEDMSNPVHKRLTLMVQQNTQRLAQIVDEILDIARVEHLNTNSPGNHVVLDEAVRAMCNDWLKQDANDTPLMLDLSTGTKAARFTADHLRRVLVNLLDNARRYAGHVTSIHVSTGVMHPGQLVLRVWSDGPPLEQAVQRHLFEPFFSSDSRSSGLGLYICSELCERHDAVIAYERTSRAHEDRTVDGNEFSVIFKPAGPDGTSGPAAPATSH